MELHEQLRQPLPVPKKYGRMREVDIESHATYMPEWSVGDMNHYDEVTAAPDSLSLRSR